MKKVYARSERDFLCLVERDIAATFADILRNARPAAPVGHMVGQRVGLAVGAGVDFHCNARSLRGFGSEFYLVSDWLSSATESNSLPPTDRAFFA